MSYDGRAGSPGGSHCAALFMPLTFGCGVELLYSYVFYSDLSYTMVAFFMVAAVDFMGVNMFILVFMGSAISLT